MKRIMTIIVSVLVLVPMACADDKAFEFNKLPVAAKEFILKYFPTDKVLVTTVDDDRIKPDYEVMLESGAKIGFENNGNLEKVEMRGIAIPDGIVPTQIVAYLVSNYPDASVFEYEVGRKEYEVKLSNRVELKFDAEFKLIGIEY